MEETDKVKTAFTCRQFQFKNIRRHGEQFGHRTRSTLRGRAKTKRYKQTKQWVTDYTKPEPMAIAGESHFLKTLCNQWSQLNISNRLLVIRREEPETNTMHELAVVPLNLRRTVLRYMHDNKPSGHLV